MAPQGVAGDLECAVTDSNAGTAEVSYATALAEAARRGGGTTRGSLDTVTEAPLDVRPGQGLVFAPDTLAGYTPSYRVSGVEVSWQSPTVRTYRVGFGDLQPNPSAMNHSGRFRERPSAA